MKSIQFIAFMFLSLNFVTPVMASEAGELSALRGSFTQADVTPLSEEKPDIESEEIVELGRFLFFDKILSGNKNISCSTCHHTSLGSSDGLPLPMGTGSSGLGPKRRLEAGHFIPRNAPAAFNLGYKSFHKTMWDGRIAIDPSTGWLNTPEPKINGQTPELTNLVKELKNVAAAQALFPVTSNEEMRGFKGENEIADAKDNPEVWRRLTKRLVGSFDGTVGGIQEYKDLFLKAYPELNSLNEVNFGHVARAIAAFEIFAFDASKSPFDAFLEGEDKALSFEEIQGAQIFVGKGSCVTCHSGTHLTDFKFYSLAAPQLGPGKEKIEGLEGIGEDRGLAGLTGEEKDLYRFKTPTLRNVEVTGPWLHSGAFYTLEDTIRHHILPQTALATFSYNPSRYLNQDFLGSYMSLVDRSHERNQARLDSHASELRYIRLSNLEIKSLVTFLKSLTDRGFESRGFSPVSVPSGLPVED